MKKNIWTTKPLRAYRTLDEAEEIIKYEGYRYLDGSWNFSINRRLKSTMGQCCTSRRSIEINAKYAMYLKTEHLEQLLLHEIAHGIVGGYNGHNKVFKDKCKEIGCTTAGTKWDNKVHNISYVRMNKFYDDYKFSLIKARRI